VPPDSSRSVGISKVVDSCQKVRHEVWGALAATSPAKNHTFLCFREHIPNDAMGPWRRGP